MGYGQITGGGEDGLYTVALDFGSSRRDALKAQYEARIAQLEAQLPALEAKRGQFEAEIQAAREVEKAAIRVYIEALLLKAPEVIIAPLRKSLSLARSRVLAAELAKLTIETPIDALKTDIKGLRLQIAQLMAGEVQKTVQAWCADLTEDGTGQVATIEVPGEPQTVLIAPGCRANGPADGAVLARQVMTPSQAFFNAAVLPGWQKHRPTYRIATITAIDMSTDTADVAFVAAASSAQGLDVNRETTKAGVPVVYMTCNAGAFSVGDRVVVEFVGQTWEGARVIGFESNPKSCNWPCVFATAFYYNHIFESKDPETLAELTVSGGIAVEYRFNRAGWQSLQFLYTVSASGGRNYWVWGSPVNSNSFPTVEIGQNFYLSPGFDPLADKVDGFAVYPGGATFQGGPPTILELRISKAGKVIVNCAFRWDPSNFSPSETHVLAQGGIKTKGYGSIVLNKLEGYELFIKTGD
jgi:hypothetical protein